MNSVSDTIPASKGDSQHVGFLLALFQPRDIISIRLIESWGGERRWVQSYYARAESLVKPAAWKYTLLEAKRERANVYFGVCPRPGEEYDQSWQIREVRALWADIDHCTPDEALSRCAAADVPRPSITINSGNGTHLYWLLAETYFIDAAGRPPQVKKKWMPQVRKYRRFVVDPTGREFNLGARDFPYKVSPKAIHVQQLMKGIAAKIGGDHTSDLARVLRMPGTMNRKDERQGRCPVPCFVVEIDGSRRYSVSEFEQLHADP